MMQNYIYLRAYLNDNLGDDLFIHIIGDRYPQQIFKVFDINKSKAEKFPSNIEFLLEEVDIDKFEYDRVRFEKIRNKRILNHLIVDCFLPENRQKRKILKKAKLKIYVIGSGFMEGGKIGIEYYLNEKSFFKNNSYLIGSNFGPYKTVRYKEIHKKLFSMAKDICFRDSYSEKEFEMLPNVRQEADIVFSYKNGEQEISNLPLGYILISVVNLNKDNEENTIINEKYITFLVNLTKKYIEIGKKVYFVGFCKNQKDDIIIDKVIAKLLTRDKKNIQVFNYPNTTYKEIMWLFKNADGIVASRYHAAIIGMLYQKNLYILSYSDKINHVLYDIDKEIKYINITEGININPEIYMKNYGYTISSERLNELKKSAERQFLKLDAELLNKESKVEE